MNLAFTNCVRFDYQYPTFSTFNSFLLQTLIHNTTFAILSVSTIIIFRTFPISFILFKSENVIAMMMFFFSAENCKKLCTDTGSGAEECPKVYSCPKAKEQRTRHKGSVSGVQCRALKYPSGKIKCAYKNVTAKKEEYQSYIMFPRINFAGKLQIDSATLNNVFSNFDIKTFAPADTRITDENWNPMGSSDFRLVDVSVTRVCHAENLCVYQPHEDPLAGAPIKDQANGKVSAKIVDLDIEVQGRLSEIYGLSIDVGGFFQGRYGTRLIPVIMVQND